MSVYNNPAFIKPSLKSSPSQLDIQLKMNEIKKDLEIKNIANEILTHKQIATTHKDVKISSDSGEKFQSEVEKIKNHFNVIRNKFGMSHQELTFSIASQILIKEGINSLWSDCINLVNEIVPSDKLFALGGGWDSNDEELLAQINEHRKSGLTEVEKKHLNDTYSSKGALTKNYIENRTKQLASLFISQNGRQPSPTEMVRFKEEATRQAYLTNLNKNIEDGYYNPKIIPFEMNQILGVSAEVVRIDELNEAKRKISDELDDFVKRKLINPRQRATILENVIKSMDLYVSGFKDQSKNEGELYTKAFIVGRDMARIAVYEEKFDKAAFTGSDHGSKHIHHNIQNAVDMIKDMTGIPLTDKDLFLINLVHFYHDVGYSVGSSAFSFDVMKDHPIVGAKMLEEHSSYFINLMGESAYNTLFDSVLYHAIMQPNLSDEKMVDGFHPGLVRALTSISDACAVSWDRKTQEFWEQPKAVLELARLKLLLMFNPQAFKSMMTPNDYFKTVDQIYLDILAQHRKIIEIDEKIKALPKKLKEEYPDFKLMRTRSEGQEKFNEEKASLEVEKKLALTAIENLEKMRETRVKEWEKPEYQNLRMTFIQIKENLLKLADNENIEEDKRLAFKGAVESQLNSLTSKITLGQYGAVLHKMGAELVSNDGEAVRYRAIAYLAPSLIYGVLEDLFGADQAGEAIRKIGEEFGVKPEELVEKIEEMAEKMLPEKLGNNSSNTSYSSAAMPTTTAAIAPNNNLTTSATLPTTTAAIAPISIVGKNGKIVIENNFDIQNESKVWDISGTRQTDLNILHGELVQLREHSIRHHIKTLFKSLDDLISEKIDYATFSQKQKFFISVLYATDLADQKMLEEADKALKGIEKSIAAWTNDRKILNNSFVHLKDIVVKPEKEPNVEISKIQSKLKKEILDLYKSGSLNASSLQTAVENSFKAITQLKIDSNLIRFHKDNLSGMVVKVKNELINNLTELMINSKSLSTLQDTLNSKLKTKYENEFMNKVNS